MKSALFIELNEFNFELLKEYAQAFHLKNIQKILSFKNSQTFTEDLYESDFLEPWVQWVNVHTGQPSKEHQIKHLGDVPHLHSEQIWQKLSKKNITSGIWGAMNASKEDAKNCLFFLPDPWTASESAYPSELSPLLDLLRYSSKNYLKTSKLFLLHKIAKVVGFLAQEKVLFPLVKEMPHLIKTLKAFKNEAFAFISLFDYLSTLLFLKQKEKHSPQFSLIFLNSLAHMQHHHWNKPDGRSKERFFYGLTYLDRSIGLLIDSMKPSDLIVVANALSQKCTLDEEPWILYRQKDQTRFLKHMGLSFSKVEAHMTHDAHIFFDKKKDCLKAYQALKSATIRGQPFFEVESYKEDPLKLFYKIIFTNEMKENATFLFNGKEHPFFDHFKKVVQRMGKHIQTANVLCNQEIFSKNLFNHEIFNAFIDYFEAPSKERYSSKIKMLN